MPDIASPATKTVKKYYTIAGRRVAMHDGTQLLYLTGDHLSSTSLVMNAAGAVLSEQRYTPFGQVRAGTGSITQTDFGYTGQRNYADSGGFGLMDYNARFYDPTTFRFTQPDSIIPNPANSQSLNRYSYGYNNPVKYNDPSGHTSECGDGGGCEGDPGEEDPYVMVQKYAALQADLVGDGIQTDLGAMRQILRYSYKIANEDMGDTLTYAASAFYRKEIGWYANDHSYTYETENRFGVTGFGDKYVGVESNNNQIEHFIAEAGVIEKLGLNQNAGDFVVDQWDTDETPGDRADRELGYLASWWVSQSYINPDETLNYLDQVIDIIASNGEVP